MGKLEAAIKSEIERLSRRELRRIAVPLRREVRSLKITASKLRRAVIPLERFAALQQKESAKREARLEVSPEELKKSRLSPRLIKTLRKKLGITQKQLAILTGVTTTAVQSWEAGKFTPKAEKKAALAALRKLGRGDVKKLLVEKASKTTKPKR